MSRSLLDVDESIFHRNLLFNKDEEEFQTLLSAAMEGSTSTLSGPAPHQKELVKTVHPIPGICIKTHDLKTKQKVFINICHTSILPEPMDISESELTHILESDEPSNYRVPMSIGAPHEEQDKSGLVCTAYDVAVNSKFFDKITSSLIFQTFVITATIEGLEDKHNTLLDKNGWIVLQNRRHMGTVKPHQIRYNEEKPPVQEIPKPEQLGRETPSTSLITEVDSTLFASQTPLQASLTYLITKAQSKDGHIFAIIEFTLPAGVDMKSLNVSMGQNYVTLEASNCNANVTLPFSMDFSRAKAAFNRIRKMITVLAPVQE